MITECKIYRLFQFMSVVMHRPLSVTDIKKKGQQRILYKNQATFVQKHLKPVEIEVLSEFNGWS